MPKYRFGKHPRRSDYRTLRFKNYLTPAVPKPPASDDVLARVYKQLHDAKPQELFPMDGNDTLGDCTIAAAAHAITAFCGLIGTKQIMAGKDVIKTYKHLTGGPDTGLNELDVLRFWRKSGIGNQSILAFASLDTKSHAHVKTAIHMFGGVYLGFQVQEGAIERFDAREPWIPAPLTNDGHAVYAVGYDHEGLTVLTWGNTQRATWGWWDECVDEAYVLLPPQAKNPKFAPGFNIAQLTSDLAAIGNVAPAAGALSMMPKEEPAKV